MIRTAAALLFAGVLVAGMNAQPARGWGYGGYGRSGGEADFEGPGRMARWSHLDLTDAQQEQLQALRLEHYKEVKPLRSKMAELKARERTLMLEDKVDMKALNSVIDEQSELSNNIRKLRAAHRVDVRALLTDEQKMILDQRNSFRHQRRGGNYGRGPGHGWGPGAGWGPGSRCPYASGSWGQGPGARGQGPADWGQGPRGWRSFQGEGEDQPKGENL